MKAQTSQNPYENALAQLARASAVGSVNQDILTILGAPDREIKVSIPITLDNGTLKIFEGYRVQYSNILGPYKGGIRFHPETNSDEVKALALWMTIKTAVMNLPMGGGKGGVTVNPKELSLTELEKLSRGWSKMLAPNLGSHVDVPAPDVNTNGEIMGWMNDEYKKISGEQSNATFTGKKMEDGGSEGRTEATGLGGFYAFDAIKNKLDLPTSCRIIIQGMGNVGGHAADIFTASGHKLIGISDSKGGIINLDGLDIKEVESYKKEHGTLEGFPHATYVTNQELLETEADVLIPAALENQITQDNADRIKARVVLELANGPTTPEADDVLFAKKIHVIPDVLANAGGVTVSTFEWEQNLKNEYWTKEEVHAKLRDVMTQETHNVWTTAQKHTTDMRRAAFIVALDRLSDSLSKKK